MRKIVIVIGALVGALIWGLLAQSRVLSRYKEDNQRLSQSYIALQSQSEQYRTKAEELAAEGQAMTLKLDELEAWRAEDAKTIASLRNIGKGKDKPTQLVRNTVYIRDTVRLEASRDTGVWCYNDAWLTACVDNADTTLSYSIKDSLTIVTRTRYTKRFLWWRYRPVTTVSAVSHNPQTTHVSIRPIVIVD